MENTAALAKKLGCDTAECPHVDFLIMCLIKKQFWSHVVQGAQSHVFVHRFLILPKQCCIAKVRQLDVWVLFNIEIFHQDVVWLQITMADALLVQIVDSLDKLLHDVDDCRFFYDSLPLAPI